MSWKRWAVVIALGALVVKAPHETMAALASVGHSLATFWDALGLH